MDKVTLRCCLTLFSKGVYHVWFCLVNGLHGVSGICFREAHTCYICWCWIVEVVFCIPSVPSQMTYKTPPGPCRYTFSMVALLANCLAETASCPRLDTCRVCYFIKCVMCRVFAQQVTFNPVCIQVFKIFTGLTSWQMDKANCLTPSHMCAQGNNLIQWLQAYQFGRYWLRHLLFDKGVSY